MIGRLTGTVVDEAADGTIVLDVAGVGYEVHVPLGMLGRLSAVTAGAAGAVGGLGAPRENITLHVHTNVREDAISLFGFATADDKVAFRTLLGVSGVGPKVALSILSSLDSSALAHAIESNDKNAFKGISGVGKKTVEHLLVDLKGKLHPGAGPAVRPAPARPLAVAPNADIVVALLVNMGFKRLEAEAALAGLGPERIAQEPVDRLLREALGRLG